MIILAIMSQLGLLMKDLGYGVQVTASLVIVYTAVSIVFQFAGGYIGDRVPKNVALFAFTALQAVAVVVLVLAPNLAMIFLFAVLFGVGFGGRTPLTTAIRGDYFGRASFGKILGISTLPMNAMLLIAGPMAGFMRDQLGDYDLASPCRREWLVPGCPNARRPGSEPRPSCPWCRDGVASSQRRSRWQFAALRHSAFPALRNRVCSSGPFMSSRRSFPPGHLLRWQLWALRLVMSFGTVPLSRMPPGSWCWKSISTGRHPLSIAFLP